MSQARIYFVISCARSGSTSLGRILDTATNGQCLVEPVPDLNTQTRDMMEGRLVNPHRVLVERVIPRIAQTLDQGLIYGEKNQTFGPFIPYLHEMLRCKFVWLIRDGRDVVTSLMNWHNEAFGSIYRECQDPGPLSELARATVSKLPVSEDTSDYSRPRPGPTDPFHKEWPRFSRFEMVVWYWAYINRLFKRQLVDIPHADWICFDYTAVTVDKIANLFQFLGLQGFDATQVDQMLNARINSVEERFNTSSRFPRWKDWSAGQIERFDRIACGAMKEFGYYPAEA